MLFRSSVFRFLLGLGECGNYSGGVKVISEWFSARERALAGGIFNTGSVIGSLAAPYLVMRLATAYGWQFAFLLPSLLGLLWILPWVAVYRPRGDGPAGQSPAGVRIPLGSRQLWGMMLVRALGGPVNHFYWYWLPEYLRRERGFSLEQIGLWAGLPFFFGGLGNVAGGWLSSFLMARGSSADHARKTALALAVLLCLTSMGVPLCATGYQALVLICAASFGIGAYAATWIGAVTDIFPGAVVARVTGLAGMGEGVANMILTLATGRVVDRYSYLPVFLGASLLPALGLASLFLVVRSIEKVKIW